jgi:hypothetical protein
MWQRSGGLNVEELLRYSGKSILTVSSLAI